NEPYRHFTLSATKIRWCRWPAGPWTRLGANKSESLRCGKHWLAGPRYREGQRNLCRIFLKEGSISSISARCSKRGKFQGLAITGPAAEAGSADALRARIRTE